MPGALNLLDRTPHAAGGSAVKHGRALGWLALVLALVCLAGCGARHPHPNLPLSTYGADASTGQDSPTPEAEAPAPATRGWQVQQIPGLEFSVSTYRLRARQNRESFGFSPLSLGLALEMLAEGAKGKTRSQLQKALGRLGGPLALEQRGLKLANCAWIDRRCRIKGPYTRTLQQNYRAELRSLDFRHPEAARREINQWAARETEGRIPQLASPGGLSPQTRLVLTSSLYLKAPWDKPFPPQNSGPEPFHCEAGPPVSATMMRGERWVAYASTSEVALVELPYAGDGGLVMDLLLPSRPSTLKALESRLSAPQLAAWLGQLKGTQVKLAIPRFAWAEDFQWRELLEALGIREAFDSRWAQLPGISRDKLALAGVQQANYLQVDEEGTVAAAVTAPNATPGAPTPEDRTPPIPEFRADHPFLYLLRQPTTQAVLFIGRVTRPD